MAKDVKMIGSQFYVVNIRHPDSGMCSLAEYILAWRTVYKTDFVLYTVLPNLMAGVLSSAVHSLNRNWGKAEMNYSKTNLE